MTPKLLSLAYLYRFECLLRIETCEMFDYFGLLHMLANQINVSKLPMPLVKYFVHIAWKALTVVHKSNIEGACHYRGVVTRVWPYREVPHCNEPNH